MEELGGHVSGDVLARAKTLVLATAGHRLPVAGDPDLLSDCAFFLDMDLSILGADTHTFDTYEKAIREEYRFVSFQAFRTGRATILEDFIGRERLYFTDAMHDRFDRLARQNLERSLKALKPAGQEQEE